MSVVATLAFEVNTPAGTFSSFTEAAAAGFPVACEWFARCENPADVAVKHPILTAVPTCNRCKARLEDMG